MEDFLKSSSLERFTLHGFIFDNYIGTGASGNVYRHKQNNEDYAVKVLKIEDWEEEKEFFEDVLWQTSIIKHMGKLKGSIHFVGFDVVRKNNIETIALIMEYFDCEGDLYDYINKKVFWTKSEVKNGYSFPYGNIYVEYLMGKKEKLEITKKMINSVNELHSKRVGIVHGDIKTNNIVLDKIGNLKTIDFGASIFSEECGGFCKTDWKHGTLGYSSPEDYNYYLLGKQSDIYSLGVSLIELWAGRIWGDSDDFNGCRNEVLKSLRLIEKNDKEIGIILRKMVTINSKKRPKIEKIIKDIKNIKYNI